MRNAYEYWWLAKLLLHTTAEELEIQHGGVNEDFRRVLFEDDKMDYIRSIMKRYCAPDLFDEHTL